MPHPPVWLAAIILALSAPLTAAQTEPHRATRLGNPATRFAPPLKTPEDLRRTLLNDALRDDVQLVARKTGFNGDMEDFRRAVRTAPIRELRIPPNTLLPAMSARKKGKVDVIHNVLWAGKQPIEAYEFSFVSGEKRYRVVTPKACSNFWVEEQPPPPKPELSLECTSPAESRGDGLVQVCCTLKNIGELAEPRATVVMPFVVGAQVRCVSGGVDTAETERLVWNFSNLVPGDSRTFCVNQQPLQAGVLRFGATARGERSSEASSVTQTQVDISGQ